VYWLRSALEDSRTVFEIGGHIGEAFYGFARVLPYPPDLQWTICDVPTICVAGEKLARERGKTNLRFVPDLRQTEGAEILLAAGALQYFEPPTLAETIAPWRIRPKHILVNVTPVYDGPSFVTLQNIGSAYCPYRIFSRQEFIGALENMGYTLVDAWRKDRALSIPGHPERSFDHYSGFYFRAR
jgi:putative methyltransferase (TIGR04325 family)